MLDNLENKVIESFDNYEIKLTGNDILTKFRNKKVKKVNKPVLISSCLGFSFACALLVILVPNILNNEKSAKKFEQDGIRGRKSAEIVQKELRIGRIDIPLFLWYDIENLNRRCFPCKRFYL